MTTVDETVPDVAPMRPLADADDEAGALDRVVGDGRADHDRVDDLRHPARRVLLPARLVDAMAARRDQAAGARARRPVQLRVVGEQHPDLLRGGGDPSRFAAWPAGGPARRAACMGAAFLAFTVKDFHDLTFGWRDNAYGSIFYTIVGLHALHVFVGLCMNVARPDQGVAGQVQRRAPHERRGASASTGTSSTRCGSSCSLSLFLSEACAMTLAEVERHRDGVAAASRRRGLVRRLRRHRRLDRAPGLRRRGRALDASPPAVSAGPCTPRPACARWRRSSRSLLARPALPSSRRASDPASNDDARPAAVPRPARPARRRDQPGADPARGQLRAVHSPWLTSIARQPAVIASPLALLVVCRGGTAYAMGRDRLDAGPRDGPWSGIASRCPSSPGLVDGRGRAGVAARHRRRHVAFGAHDPARPAALGRRARCSPSGCRSRRLLWALPDRGCRRRAHRLSRACRARPRSATSRRGSRPRSSWRRS